MNAESSLLILLALGAFHGLNPAMGWLFAVALGQQEGRSTAVLRALPPIALGHLLSVAGVVGAAVLAGAMVPAEWLRLAGGVLLLGFALWLFLRGARHARWVGMRLRPRDLVLWSLGMTTAHGAGLMLLPAVLAAPPVSAHAHHAAGAAAAAASPLLALAVHSVAMLGAMAAAAVAAHWALGLGFLRRRWVNLEIVWIVALVLAAVTLLLG